MMTGLEGQISITVRLEKMSAIDVEVTSSRPLHAAKIFIGKTPEQVMDIIPLLFNICGVAQSRAALSSIQNQLDIKADPELEKARDIMVLAENAKEHLLRIFLDWPELFEQDLELENLAYVGQLLMQFKQSLFYDGQAFKLESKMNTELLRAREAVSELESYLKDNVFCMPTRQWLEILTFDDLSQWAKQCFGIAAETLHIICEQGWTYQGTTQCRQLPYLGAKQLEQIFESDDVEDFIAAPQWQGHCHETSALTRQIDQPLIKALHEEFYTGLITRWAARLIEIARIPAQMSDLLDQIHNPATNGLTSSGQNGIADVEAARGRLIHRVTINCGLISNYQILAPTEWNFHPQGLIKESLKSITAKDKDEWKHLASLLINAIDPCVGYQLRIH
ncbi:MAG: hypothetical protein GWO88_00220 [Planctomycetia bacterium]|nr:hypothetical protein [Planctomycetia bacterium]